MTDQLIPFQPPRPPPPGIDRRRAPRSPPPAAGRGGPLLLRRCGAPPASTTGWGSRLLSHPPPGAPVPRLERDAGAATSRRTRSSGRCRGWPIPPPGRSRWEGRCASRRGSPWRCSEALPRVTYTVKHHCVEGWSAIGTWTGVPLASVVALVEPTADARYLRFDTFDASYYNGWDLESALHPQTILAYAFNDRPLEPEHGAPAAALLAGQARLQADQVPDQDDFHRREARRLLGGPGVPLARRDLSGI